MKHHADGDCVDNCEDAICNCESEEYVVREPWVNVYQDDTAAVYDDERDTSYVYRSSLSLGLSDIDFVQDQPQGLHYL